MHVDVKGVYHITVSAANSNEPIHRVAQKSKPLPNDQINVLNRIKACQWD